MQYYTGPGRDGLTVEELQDEINVHLPYLMLEQSYFLFAVGGGFQPQLICQYQKLQQFFGHTSPIDCMQLPIKGEYEPKLGV